MAKSDTWGAADKTLESESICVRLLLCFALALLGLESIRAEEPMIFLVRLAEKATSSDAKDPDLSEAGRKRAQLLCEVVKGAGVTAIFATEFKRTQETAEPFSKLSQIPITIVPARETAALVAKIKSVTGSALVVGHSNTLPEIIKALGVQQGIELSESDYDDIFIVQLETTPPTLLHRRYQESSH